MLRSDQSFGTFVLPTHLIRLRPSPEGNDINLRMASERSQRDVVLSEQSESKDLRIDRDRSGKFGAKIFRLRFAPLKMTRSF